MRWRLIATVPRKWWVPRKQYSRHGPSNVWPPADGDMHVWPSGAVAAHSIRGHPLPPIVPPVLPPKQVDRELPVDPSGLYRINVE